jgi:hypothetical protein
MARPTLTAAEAPRARKGQGDVKLTREEFARRLGERFDDPAFDAARSEISRVIEIAWKKKKKDTKTNA